MLTCLLKQRVVLILIVLGLLLETVFAKNIEPKKDESISFGEISRIVLKKNVNIVNSRQEVIASSSLWSERKSIFYPKLSLSYSKSEQDLSLLDSSLLGAQEVEANAYSASLLGEVPQAGLFYEVGIIEQIEKNFPKSSIKKQYESVSQIELGLHLWKDNFVYGNTFFDELNANRKKSQFQFKLDEIETIRNLYFSYLEVYFLQESVKSYEEAVKIAEDLVGKAKNLLQIGRISGQDLLGAEIQLALLKSRVDDLLVSRNEKIKTLSDLINDESVSYNLLSQVSFIIPDLTSLELPAEWSELEEEKTPLINLLSEEKNLALVNLSRAKNNHRPQLDLVLSLAQATDPGANSPYPFERDYGEKKIELNFSMPLHFGLEKARVRQAQIRAQSASRIEKANLLQIRNKYFNNFSKIKIFKEKLITSKVLEQKSEARLRSAVKIFELGSIPKKTVYDFQIEALDSKLDRINTDLQLALLIADMYFIRGESSMFLSRLEAN